jgi:hypothetical protein
MRLYADIIEEIASWRSTGVLVLTFQKEPLLDARLEDWIKSAAKELGTNWQIR